MNTLKFNNLINQLKTISSLNFRRKMSTEINPTMNNEHNIVWFDGEMTGLDCNHHTLIEAAIIITDKNLKVLAESPNIIIHQSDKVLENMEEWSKKHHGISGLTENVRKSNISIEQADQMLYEFIKPFAPKGVCPLAGNSIHMDRTFIRKYMPKLESHLSYRLIDVSTLKELLKRWKPELANEVPIKSGKHRALDDIKESVQELQFYKSYLNL
ncbi:oligoribonuclease isoform X1 [Acyrthosiphon pisum]|uniref:Probable oligoribonuclease n=1 Tax=Acyrthosiphon pisum TaxID=7029 RepID=A0A8R1W2H5_ACYPI|nr:oligoribonuclease isoform X1 [Acyrthosiphon pisum]XP_016659401.1 oligoribonuclease isoform X1 [Acyrthosiphon pisum]|eukprot:XP_001950486.2 PREDICTED: oligoribonuclease isoform X1 [Acyrthosiphon pisum]